MKPPMNDNTQQPTPPLLIVTDLDGTLLDHDSYRFDPARPALARAQAAGIPVIPNTSKTRAELLPLREALGNSDPFIVENGSAICIPEQHLQLHGNRREVVEGYLEEVLGTGIEQIHAVLHPLRDRYRFETFSDWSDTTLIAHTGLDPASARAARTRRFSEALLWQDSDAARDAFLRALDDAGLHALQGGRFLSVLGSGADKGKALDWLRQLYRPVLGDTPCVIALGDSPNDCAMLAAADIAVIIANPAAPAMQLHGPQVIRSHAPGPAGWNEAVQQLLDRFHIP